jgi:hypothetical protein
MAMTMRARTYRLAAPDDDGGREAHAAQRGQAMFAALVERRSPAAWTPRIRALSPLGAGKVRR